MDGGGGMQMSHDMEKQRMYFEDRICTGARSDSRSIHMSLIWS